jgi:Lipase maturation factor
VIATDWFSAPEYSLARLLFRHALGAVYLIAFLVALNQFRPLLGERGLLPVPRFVRVVPFRRSPSIFHLHYSDRLLATVAGAGAALAAIGVVGLLERIPLWSSMLAWLILWVLYLSIVNVGQVFYTFGWESLLLEVGFLAIFLGPSVVATPSPVVWLLRWVLFRVEFGAGLIKLRGDACWRDLTCLNYHHETQPMPNPLSWYFHHLPQTLHKAEVLANHCAQLVVPFGLFSPQPIASIAGVVIAVTQLWLVASGNFSWLNLAAIVLALSTFDDRFLHTVLPISAPTSVQTGPTWHVILIGILVATVAALSYWPVRNMLSRRQLMNYSFDPLHLVNTYGAFGSITRVRNEIVIEGTDDPQPGTDTVWREYEFKGKPGDPHRRPPQIAPYHLRLDWLMWFAALSPAYAEAWFAPLLVKLLENDTATLKLLRASPFGDGPPVFVRARLYRYRFATRDERRKTGAWWIRTSLGDYLEPVSLRGDDRWTSARSASQLRHEP